MAKPKVKNCVDCGKPITKTATRCCKCAAKGRGVGSKHSPETKHKISRAAKARWQDEARRNKMSATIKERWQKGILGNPIHLQGLSRAMKIRWQNGELDDPEYRQRLSESLKNRWGRGDFDGVFQSPTSIELQVAAALDMLSIEHESQYRPEGYGRTYDEFVPPNILVEIHGDYWHGPEHPDTQQRDKEKAVWAKANDYTLITIWEHEIQECGAWALVIEKVLPLIGGVNE